MKKNKLIEVLTNIKGNPDILLWNGFVGDWQDIDADVVETFLVKSSFENHLRRCELDVMKDKKDWDFRFSEEEVEDIKKSYAKNYCWEYNHFVTREDISKGYYKEKKVFMLNTKKRGESTFDRAGNIEY